MRRKLHVLVMLGQCLAMVLWVAPTVARAGKNGLERLSNVLKEGIEVGEMGPTLESALSPRALAGIFADVNSQLFKGGDAFVTRAVVGGKRVRSVVDPETSLAISFHFSKNGTPTRTHVTTSLNRHGLQTRLQVRKNEYRLQARVPVEGQKTKYNTIKTMKRSRAGEP